MNNSSKVFTGKLVNIDYKGHAFKTVVIEPNGMGYKCPTVGYNFREAEKHLGIPHSTLSTWVVGSEGNQSLKLPSGNTYRVVGIFAEDGNNYSVINASDWVDICEDLILKQGRSKKESLKKSLVSFLKWFAIEGFYPAVYTELFGAYTQRHKTYLKAWSEAREAGKATRSNYTELLKENGVCAHIPGDPESPYYRSYAYWTNYIYTWLFAKSAKLMKEQWTLVDGSKSVARNYISQEDALKMVAFAEATVVALYCPGDTLEEIHDLACERAKKKFKPILEGQIPKVS